MNGIHDMGGMDGFGPVIREENEPVFHAAWEKRMFGLASAIPFAVSFADDHLRREIERIPPADYLRANYYELWYRALSQVLAERGVFADGRPAHAGPALAADAVPAAILAGATTRMEAPGVVARFALGEAVTTINHHPTDHTRLPRYARGKTGVIIRNHGTFSFADSNARGDGPAPQHLYAVEFAADEVWGHAFAATGDSIILDLWDAYLEPAA